MRGFEEGGEVEVRSVRAYNFYNEYLDSVNHTLNKGSVKLALRSRLKNIPDFIEECETKINERIQYLTKNDYELKSLSKDIKYAFERTQLSEDDFEWLNKKEERFCNWVWSFLKETTMKTNNDLFCVEPFLEERNMDYIGVYNRHIRKTRLSIEPFSSPPINMNDRLCAITKSFEYSETTKTGQVEIIDYIKKVWGYIYLNNCSNNFVNWLNPSNKEQCEWTWNYFQSIENRRLKSFFSTWAPHNLDEKVFAMIAAVDMGVLKNLERTELLLSKLKKAWSQKKFRDKSGGKKAYSINMTPKTKERLDELAEHHELKLNEVIAKLIKQEHDFIINN